MTAEELQGHAPAFIAPTPLLQNARDEYGQVMTHCEYEYDAWHGTMNRKALRYIV
jgi:hypothetical protein